MVSFSRSTPLPRSKLTYLCLAFLLFATSAVSAQSPKPSPELKKWDVWRGDWTLSGTAKDTPTSPEYKLNWFLHEHWILDGFFMQVDQTWKAKGQEQHALEILSYDPEKKVHTVSGFAGDGSTWNLTAKFAGATVIEDGAGKGPNGEVQTCRMTWVFSDDRMAISGTQVCELGGVRWTSLRVHGRKSGSIR